MQLLDLKLTMHGLLVVCTEILKVNYVYLLSVRQSTGFRHHYLELRVMKSSITMKATPSTEV